MRTGPPKTDRCRLSYRGKKKAARFKGAAALREGASAGPAKDPPRFSSLKIRPQPYKEYYDHGAEFV